MTKTVLAIDEDVVTAAIAMAKRERRPVEAVVSSLARAALSTAAGRTYRNGVPLLPTRDPTRVVTADLVRSLLDDEE